MFSISAIVSTLALASVVAPVAAQTYTSCNPLTSSDCPADTALGKSVSIDFTSGASDEFTASGAPTYDSNGAGFTVAKSGDSPTITSKWYFMFGHVDFVIKAAPGTGIVSSAVLLSDDLDEIDWEWLGGDDTQVQSNYFGKGLTTTYNRGAFHAASGNHDEYHTYSIDWTADQIVWSVDGTTVRAMTQADAVSGQYPQSPMMVKVGTWAGGDPSNPAGTIEWAGGETDYSQGPFTMYLKSIHVSDYSTGSQYTYSGTSGTWESIQSTGGQINSDGTDTPASASTTSSSAPAVTSSNSGSGALGFGNGGTATTTSTFPWSGSATATVVTSVSSASSSISGLPSGWTVNSSGKVVPPSSGSTTSPSTSSAAASSSAFSSDSGLELSTSWDSKGFPTLVTVNPTASSQPASYDSQGFLITSTASTMSNTTVLTSGTPMAVSTSMSWGSNATSAVSSSEHIRSSLPVSSGSMVGASSKRLSTSTSGKGGTTTRRTTAIASTATPAAVAGNEEQNEAKRQHVTKGIWLFGGLGILLAIG